MLIDITGHPVYAQTLQKAAASWRKTQRGAQKACAKPGA
jgi:hypothetical protein